MDEKQRRDNSQDLDIDLRRLFHSLEKKSLLISIVTVVTAVVTYLGT